jgi:hypothetical protein
MIRMGLASLDRVTGPWGQGGGWPILAGPCHNFKGANDLDERSRPADGENAFSILSRPSP